MAFISSRDARVATQDINNVAVEVVLGFSEGERNPRNSACGSDVNEVDCYELLRVQRLGWFARACVCLGDWEMRKN